MILPSHHRIVAVAFFFLISVGDSVPLQFNYQTIEKNNPNLIARGNISYLGSEIQFTTYQSDQVGRLRYLQPLHLWDDSDGRLKVADFTTGFSFVIISSDQDNKTRDGIALFLAKPPFEIPEPIDGACIGLVTHDKTFASNDPFVALEFDTFRNDFDPQDLHEHVGINAKSMVSEEVSPWSCNILSKIPKVNNATINYNSRLKLLSVYFRGYDQDSNMPGEKKMSYEINFGKTFAGMGCVWFLSRQRALCVKPFPPFMVFSSTFPVESKNNFVLISTTVGCLSLFVVVVLIGLVLWRKRTRTEKDNRCSVPITDQLSNMVNDFQLNRGAKKFLRRIAQSHKQLCT